MAEEQATKIAYCPRSGPSPAPALLRVRVNVRQHKPHASTALAHVNRVNLRRRKFRKFTQRVVNFLHFRAADTRIFDVSRAR
jgi:hypothetical protein